MKEGETGPKHRHAYTVTHTENKADFKEKEPIQVGKTRTVIKYE